MRITENFHTVNLTTEEKITLMHNDGFTSFEIGHYLEGIDRKKAATFTKTLPPRDYDSAQILLKYGQNETTITCAICQRKTLKTKAPTRNHNELPLYYLATCETCNIISDNENPLSRNSIPRALVKKENNIAQRNSSSRIPKGYLGFLYLKQQGKCFYTGRTLELFNNKPMDNSLSVDRIIFDESYREGNIVLVVNKVNVVKSDMTLTEMKKWTPQWFDKINLFYSELNSYIVETN